MNATELFDELRAQYPGRWHRGQLMTFRNRVRLWREEARARGVEIAKSGACDTDNRRNHVLVAGLTHWNLTGRKCFKA